MHETQGKRGVKNVVFHMDGNHLPRRNTETHGAVADAVDESRKPRVADDAERSAGRAHGRRGRVVPRLKQNRFDDIHWKFRR